MSNSMGCGCGKGGCTLSMVGKVLLVVGGLNWGLVGVGMLLDSASSWNVLNIVLGSWPLVEGIVYVLVGVAAVMKIFGCKCKKCMEACASCRADGKMEGSM